MLAPRLSGPTPPWSNRTLRPNTIILTVFSPRSNVNQRRLRHFWYYKWASSPRRPPEYDVFADSQFASLHSGVPVGSIFSLRHLAKPKPTIYSVLSDGPKLLHTTETRRVNWSLYGASPDMALTPRRHCSNYSYGRHRADTFYELPLRGGLNEFVTNIVCWRRCVASSGSAKRHTPTERGRQ